MEKYIKAKHHFANNFGYVWGTNHPGFQDKDSVELYEKAKEAIGKEIGFVIKPRPNQKSRDTQEWVSGDEYIYYFP